MNVFPRLMTGPFAMGLAVAVGLANGAMPLPYQHDVAKACLLIFMNALRLVSLPIIFLAVSTTIMAMPSLGDLATLGRRTLRYTMLTTLLAASVALCLYVTIAPRLESTGAPSVQLAAPSAGYVSHLTHLVPSSLFEPFIEGNVTAILLMAAAFGAAMLTIEDRALLERPLSLVLTALLRIIRVVTQFVPLIVWAGIVESFDTLRDVATARALAGYLACVVLANLVQAIIVLPTVQWVHGISPRLAHRRFSAALSTAFFSKSSVATLPVAMRCAEEGMGVSPRIARFCFPLCTSINMNGCAAFILVTVLFVSEAHGHVHSAFSLLSWVVLASLAALGNAGVPMGCYVLSCALLGTMGVPLETMALILPFYGFIDMLETAVNVWSDATVTLCVAAGDDDSKDAPVVVNA